MIMFRLIMLRIETFAIHCLSKYNLESRALVYGIRVVISLTHTIYMQEALVKETIMFIHYIILIETDDNIKHLLDETESNIQFVASRQGNIGRSEAEPNIILYAGYQLDAGRSQVQ